MEPLLTEHYNIHYPMKSLEGWQTFDFSLPITLPSTAVLNRCQHLFGSLGEMSGFRLGFGGWFGGRKEEVEKGERVGGRVQFLIGETGPHLLKTSLPVELMAGIRSFVCTRE